MNAPCFVRKLSSASDGSARAAVAAADAQTTTTMTLGRRSKTNANKRAEEASSSLSIATRLHEEEEEEDHREPSSSSSSSSSFLKENKEILSVCGLTFVCALGHGILAPTIPIFAQNELGLSGAQIGSVLSSFAAARLCVNTAAGYFADRYGRKKLLAFGPVVTTVANGMTFMSGSYQELIGARFLAGVGSSMYTTAAAVSLSDISKSDKSVNAGNAMNLHQAAALAGAAMGPALIAGMYHTLGDDVRAPFIAATALSGTLATIAYRYAPETKGLISSATSSSSSKQNYQQQQEDLKSSASLTTPAFLNAPAVINKSNLLIEGEKAGVQYSPDRELGRLIKRKDFWSVCFLNGALFFSGAGVRGTVLPIVAINSFSFDPSQLGFLFSGMAITSLIGLVPSSKLISTFTAKKVIGPTTMLSSMAILAIAASTSDVQFAAACVSMCAAGSLMGAAPLTFVAEIAPRKASGAALSIFRNAGDVGLLLGPILSGICIDSLGSEVALAMNAAVLLTAASAFHFSRSSKSSSSKRIHVMSNSNNSNSNSSSSIK